MSKPHHISAPTSAGLPEREQPPGIAHAAADRGEHAAHARPSPGRVHELGGGDDADHERRRRSRADGDRERAAAVQHAGVEAERRRRPSRPCRRCRAARVKVVMREATSRRSMPARRIAHAVSAMPPAPALASSRVAAWPARLIWALAREADARAARRPARRREEHDVAEEGERPRTRARASASARRRAEALARRRAGRAKRRREQHAGRDQHARRPPRQEQRRRARDVAPRERASSRRCRRRMQGGRPTVHGVESLRTLPCRGLRRVTGRVTDPSRSAASRALGPVNLAALVEEEVGHHRARHARGELGGELGVARARRRGRRA